jgi:hypothetical protein
MPNYKKHLVGGCLVYGLLTYLNVKLNLITLDLNLQLQTLVACLVGSLFPDIDTKSKVQKYLYFMILALSIYLMATGLEYQACMITTMSMLPLIVSHRGLFHRLWFICMCLGIGNYLCYLNQFCPLKNCLCLSIFFLIGVISHLWLDMGWKKLFRR